MFQNILNSLHDFLINVRIADIIDVALISVFFYLILNWLRQSTSRQSIIGITSLFGLYVLARLTEMYLTELLIEALFAVILIGIVVVFQSDIRRLFERIGSWSIFWKNSHNPFDNRTTNIITEAVAKMAEKKTGALVVLKGKESIDRHIHGGITLNGKVSIPLLHSIFNPKAPGHDGAVLLEGEHITRFGAHLPLSTKLDKISGGGTRHAAALGLAEQCDALVVVVSEERGTISIAKNGTIRELESANRLKGILDEHWKTQLEGEESAFKNWWRSRDLGTAIASVALAGIFWFAFAYQT
ncbi:MAG: diadenylate cyclase, partial [Candidatus Halalkalibacterium sp. M3_1C_030]